MNTKENASGFADISILTAAIVAGVGLFLLAILSPFALLNTYQNVSVLGDAKATAENVIAVDSRFNRRRLG